MKNSQGSLFNLLTAIVPHRNKGVALSVLGDHLEITAGHSIHSHHAIEDLGIMVNGMEVTEEEYSTQITDTSEIVTVVLPFEPQPGDVITVDTDIHHLGSRTISLKVD